MNIWRYDSYRIDNLIVSAVASCGSLIASILFYFWLVLTVLYHHSSLIPGNSDLLISSIWAIAGTILVAGLAFLMPKSLKRILPSWLVVPLGSTFLFIFSLWIYVYWVSISRYTPEDPFATLPPTFEAMAYSALLFSAVLSVLSICLALLAFVVRVGREPESE